MKRAAQPAVAADRAGSGLRLSGVGEPALQLNVYAVGLTRAADGGVCVRRRHSFRGAQAQAEILLLGLGDLGSWHSAAANAGLGSRAPSLARPEDFVRVRATSVRDARGPARAEPSELQRRGSGHPSPVRREDFGVIRGILARDARGPSIGGPSEHQRRGFAVLRSNDGRARAPSPCLERPPGAPLARGPLVSYDAA